MSFTQVNHGMLRALNLIFSREKWPKRFLCIWLTVLLGSPVAYCFSIDKVQILPGLITSGTDVTVVVSISSPGGTNHYQPTHVIRDQKNIVIIIYPDAGGTGAVGHFDEVVSLGTLSAAETKLTVALLPPTITNGSGQIYTTTLTVVPNVMLSLKINSGIPSLIIDSPTNQPGLIEYSTQLNPTNWMFLAAYDTSPGIYTDSAGTNSPIRFYRVRNQGGPADPDPAVLNSITTMLRKKVILIAANGDEFMNFDSGYSVTDEFPSLGRGTYTYSANTQTRIGTLRINWANGDVYDLILAFVQNSTTSGTWSGNEHYEGVDHKLNGTFSMSTF